MRSRVLQRVLGSAPKIAHPQNVEISAFYIFTFFHCRYWASKMPVKHLWNICTYTNHRAFLRFFRVNIHSNTPTGYSNRGRTSQWATPPNSKAARKSRLSRLYNSRAKPRELYRIFLAATPLAAYAAWKSKIRAKCAEKIACSQQRHRRF